MLFFARIVLTVLTQRAKQQQAVTCTRGARAHLYCLRSARRTLLRDSLCVRTLLCVFVNGGGGGVEFDDKLILRRRYWRWFVWHIGYVMRGPTPTIFFPPKVSLTLLLAWSIFSTMSTLERNNQRLLFAYPVSIPSYHPRQPASGHFI